LLNNVENYVCHGKALDDILFNTPGMDFNSPVKGVELLLRCRHVAPIYGTSTPIAPEKKDRLVIEAVPDIVHMGHIHVYGSKRYKGITLISSSSWQEQTPFQKRVNLVPSVGLVPILDLQSHNISVLDFKESVLSP
jgi:DNA polymerase II small subunit